MIIYNFTNFINSSNGYLLVIMSTITFCNWISTRVNRKDEIDQNGKNPRIEY